MNREYTSDIIKTIPLLIILIVRTRLEVVITRRGLVSSNGNDVTRGTFLMKPHDDSFRHLDLSLEQIIQAKIGQNAYRGRSNDLLELISQVKHGNASPSEQQLHFRQEQSHARPLWALQSPPYYPKPPARFQLISAPDDKCERESVPLKPGIHAVERLNQNTRPSSLVELCSRESPHACHSILFPPWCLVSGS
ncbi:hypothetical protein VitviT2T_018076 [Vitis vinifera]|uniref:Uncharacterized protein n=1 Tax=Vitis vinifera TaxID=29760 RepID=A0ABY9CYD6_VITVI|nr:hypothetical protein VitviT2T_018076 [Vitis vinifera]